MVGKEIPLVFGYAWAAVDDPDLDRVCDVLAATSTLDQRACGAPRW